MAVEARFSVKTPGRARDKGGRYTAESYKEIVRANRAMAEKVQAYAVQNLVQNPWKRPAAHTGRLERVTADPQNRWVAADGTGWAVGVTSFLDDSIAKYWRTIEEGSAVTWSRGGMRGMRIYGNWGSGISGWYVSPSWGTQPNAVGPWRGHGAKLRGVNHEVAEARGMNYAVVQNEIEGIGYYERAWEQAHVNTVTRKQVRDLLRAAMGFTPASGGRTHPDF